MVYLGRSILTVSLLRMVVDVVNVMHNGNLQLLASISIEYYMSSSMYTGFSTIAPIGNGLLAI
jgi:hypothetical protein